MLIDTHAHLEFDDYADDLDEVIFRAKKRGVEKIVTLGVDLDRAQKAIAIAKKYKNIFAAIGIHPTDIASLELADTMQQLENMIRENKKVVAIGETGLDFYRTKPEDLPFEKKKQRKFFVSHIKLARKYSLPIIIHLRGDESLEEAKKILQEFAPVHGVVHCFSGDAQDAKECIELGLHISITGIVTFKNAKEMKEVVVQTSLEKMMVETDSPYLAPEPYRGKRNEPGYVVEVAEEIAVLKSMSFEEVCAQTTKTAENFFRI